MSVKMKVARLALLVYGLMGVGAFSWLEGREPAPAGNWVASQPATAVPASAPESALFQKQTQDGAKKAMPSIVRIGNGSGVIISADGLILTQRHVVSIRFPHATLGTNISVSLANGIEEKAELLGVDPLYDLAALRLMGPGPYSHCPLAENGPRLGDALIKLGHPAGGPTEGRPPVVRFCRVLVRTTTSLFATVSSTEATRADRLWTLRAAWSGCPHDDACLVQALDYRADPRRVSRRSLAIGFPETTSGNSIRPSTKVVIVISRGPLLKAPHRLGNTDGHWRPIFLRGRSRARSSGCH